MNASPAERSGEKVARRGALARGWRRLRPLLFLIAGSWLIASLLDYSARTASAHEAPAGFGMGLLHGACMPATWPALALGKEVVIYAVKNDGRSYDLGYTLGVNLCGALFFGMWFWRWQKWRQSRTVP
jgi:hypothetical protein